MVAVIYSSLPQPSQDYSTAVGGIKPDTGSPTARLRAVVAAEGVVGAAVK